MTNPSVPAQDEEDWAALADRQLNTILGTEPPPASNDDTKESKPQDGSQGRQPPQSRGDGTQASNGTPVGKPAEPKSDNQDPLSSLTLDELLKHPTLGPVLNKWGDGIANKRLETERPRLEEQMRPRVAAELELKETQEYLTGLDTEERGRVLARDPKLASVWADMAKANTQVNASPEQIAATAQVYALATQVSIFDKMIEQSDLPQEAKEALMDTSSFVEKGAEGIMEWGNHVLNEIVKHEKESGVTSELETRWNSLLEDRKAQIPGNKPGLLPPGRNQEPVPDIVQADSRDFLSAFN